MSVIVNSSGFSLVKSTQATATANDIIEGFTAWVNGERLVGNVTRPETIVQEAIGEMTHTFTFDKEPRAMLAEYGSNGQVQNMGKFYKILSVKGGESSGAPGQDATFGAKTATLKFTGTFGSAYTPYMRLTAIF